MLIVLPPSETKASGGQVGKMDLSFPALDSVRSTLYDDLAALPLETMMTCLKLSPAKAEEAQENHQLRQAPVMPAISRYTGVLYDALDAATLPDQARARLVIGSALFGLVRATDTIPRYRLSGGSKVPAKDGSTPTMKARWGRLITDVLAQEPFVVDLRSSTYEKLGPVPGAVTVRVETVHNDGSRTVVSHFNKHYKGALARVLASGPEATCASDVADIARGAGLTVEAEGSTLTLLT